MTASAAGPRRLVLRQRNVILGALLIAAALAWVAVLRRDGGAGHAMAGHHGGSGSLDLTMGMGPGAYLGMWVLMMAAMMFPAAAPMILTFARRQERGAHGGGAYGHTALFVAAYLALWGTLGAVALGLSLAVENLWGTAATATWSRVAAGVLVVAGAYQLSPVKDRCLANCRTPLAFFARWSRPGRWGTIRLGLVHGAYCAGCCWMFFAVLVVLGVMSAAVMIAVAAAVFAEKTLPRGRFIARALGPALVVWGIAGLIDPGVIPSAAA